MDQGGDHVVGFAVLPLDPEDVAVVQAAFNVGQELWWQQGLVVCWPAGLVAIVGLLTACRAVLTVSPSKTTMTSGAPAGYVVADRDPQQREKANRPGSSRVVSRE